MSLFIVSLDGNYSRIQHITRVYVNLKKTYKTINHQIGLFNKALKNTVLKIKFI